MAPLWTALILLFTLCFESVKAGEYCSYGVFSTYTYYCYYGCCADSCCSFFLAGWMIGLIVAGCIVFISIIVAVVFCCIKSKGQPGRVVHPLPHSGVTVISGANNSSTMQYHQQQQQQPGYYGPPQGPYGPSQGFYASGPPGYSQAYAPPPGPPAYSDPAYPPGQVNNATPFAAAAGKSPN